MISSYEHLYDNEERCWCAPKMEVTALVMTDGEKFEVLETVTVFTHNEDPFAPRGHKRRPRRPNPKIENGYFE